MKKQRILIAAAILSCAVLLMVGTSTAYFTDVEVKDNIITIGKVSIALDESPFNPEVVHPVVPGSKEEKAPKLKNDGNKDEFVFLKITIPKGNVTLLEDSGENKGKKKSDLTGEQQLFKLIANPPDTGDSNVKSIEASAGKDISFSYHSSEKGSSTANGWVLLKTNSNEKTEDEKTIYWDEYIFGYNQKMTPNSETIELFDTVQLKNFIDSQVTGEVAIGVYGYGIQADKLKTLTQEELSAPYLTQETLEKIYTIVENKTGEAVHNG